MDDRREFRLLVIIVVLAVLATAGWWLAFAYMPSYDLPNTVEQPDSRRVTYQFENKGGNIACASKTGIENTSIIRLMIENISDEDALVEFKVRAENAIISLDQSRFTDIKRITIPANTADNPTELAFHVTPDQNSTNFTLELRAIALDPSDMPLFGVLNRPDVTFYHDIQTDNYCPRN